MNAHCPSRTEATELFIRTLISEAYDGVVEDIMSTLENGPPGSSPGPELFSLHQWFRGLDDESREHLAAVVRESIDSALFHSLVLLDGLSGRLAVQGQPIDFALYLQMYRDRSPRAENKPYESVRLNPPNLAAESLHDIFHRLLQESADAEK